MVLQFITKGVRLDSAAQNGCKPRFSEQPIFRAHVEEKRVPLVGLQAIATHGSGDAGALSVTAAFGSGPLQGIDTAGATTISCGGRRMATKWRDAALGHEDRPAWPPLCGGEKG